MALSSQKNDGFRKVIGTGAPLDDDDRVSGRVHVLVELDPATSVLLSGDVTYSLPFALSIGVALGGIWLAAGLVEPPRDEAREHAPSVRRHVREARLACCVRSVYVNS